MENSSIKKAQNKSARAIRVRKKLRGSMEKPRLCVVKSNLHIHMQLIDDEKGVTLASLSTNAKSLKNSAHACKSKESARVLGEMMAEKAKALGVNKLVFDRGAHKYHGILAEVAQGLRDKGLQF